jgi:hypothetical protein
VDFNPKLFVAKLGSIAGRPLNLIPDIPINISKKLCIYLKEDMPDIENPKSAALQVGQNLIQNRTQQNISETKLKHVITLCYGCGASVFMVTDQTIFR